MIYTSLSPQPKTSFRKMMGKEVTDDLLRHFAEIDGETVKIQGLNSIQLTKTFFN